MALLIDISPVIDASIGVWPGDTPVTLTVNDIRTTLHAGAHVDAPSHLIAGGGDITSRDLDVYVGPCNVIHVDVARGARIGHIDAKKITTPRVLLRTGTFASFHAWNHDFAGLAPEVIDELHARGVVLVGIDTPSVDPFESELEAHRACGRTGIAILEGLVLDHVDEGEYELIALPLKLRGADGSVVRAVLRYRGTTS